ncbi:MAG: fumarate reductase subunit FrdD [Myxococcota bacterium]
MRPIQRLEPLFWMLFGAGGFAAALVLPALFFVLAVAFPLGWFGDPIECFHRMRTLFANPVGKGLLGAVLVLTFWHSAHHLRHFALDLGLHRHQGAVSYGLYSLALLATLATVSVLASL